MRLKERWKKFPYWLKGGVIGGLFFVIDSLVELFILLPGIGRFIGRVEDIFGVFTFKKIVYGYCISHGGCSTLFAGIFDPFYYSILPLILFSVIGIIIGFIYGKIRWNSIRGFMVGYLSAFLLILLFFGQPIEIFTREGYDLYSSRTIWDGSMSNILILSLFGGLVGLIIGKIKDRKKFFFMKSWLNGGVIGVLVGFSLFLASILLDGNLYFFDVLTFWFPFLLILVFNALGLCSKEICNSEGFFNPPLWFQIIGVLLSYGIIGALIGWIVGKIKSKRRG